MLTEKQLSELKKLLKNKRKTSNESLRIAEVTKILYPIEKKPSTE